MLRWLGVIVVAVFFLLGLTVDRTETAVYLLVEGDIVAQDGDLLRLHVALVSPAVWGAEIPVGREVVLQSSDPRAKLIGKRASFICVYRTATWVANQSLKTKRLDGCELATFVAEDEQ